MHIDLSGRTALITGSSQGIGLAIATGLARAGAAVVLTGRDAAELGVAEEQLRTGAEDARGTAPAGGVVTEEGSAALLQVVPNVEVRQQPRYLRHEARAGITVNSVLAGPTHTAGVEHFVRSLVGNDLSWDDAQRRRSGFVPGRRRCPAGCQTLTIAATGPPPEGPWCTAATDTKTAGSPVTDAATPPTVALICRCQKTSESSSIALRRPRT